MKITDIHIKNFKSLKNIELNNLSTINLLIGKNNSGKSNVLQALNVFFNRVDNEGWLGDRNLIKKINGISDKDLWFNSDNREAIEIQVNFKVEISEFKNELADIYIGSLESEEITIKIKLAYDQSTNQTIFIVDFLKWGPYTFVEPFDLSTTNAPQNRINNKVMDGSELPTDPIGAEINPNSFACKILERINRHFWLIPAKRQIVKEKLSTGKISPPLNGENIQSLIQQLKNSPNPILRKKYTKFKEVINSLPFTSGVMESVTRGEDTEINFDKEDISFSIFSQGTGIQEMLIFVTNLLLADNLFLAIEEPENHLHPEGQRFFLDFCSQQNNRNQLFFTTHTSNFIDFLDYDEGSIFLTKLKDGETTIRGIEKKEEFKDIVYELGKVSNLLLPDAVVFVEGKSDKKIFFFFKQAIKLFKRSGIEFIDVGGRGNFPYYAAIKMITTINKDLPFFYIADKHAKTEIGIKNELKKICENHNFDEDSIQLLLKSTYVLSKSEIEAYLFKPYVISRVFDIPENEIQEHFNKNEHRKNKFKVLNELFKIEKGRGYDKYLDGKKIAAAMKEVEIDKELIKMIENIISIA